MTTKEFRARKTGAVRPAGVPVNPHPIRAGNDRSAGGRVPARVLAVPIPANDDDLTPPASDLALALPAPGFAPEEVHAWAVAKLKILSEQSVDAKVRRIAAAMLVMIETGMPFASFGGRICWEKLIAATGLHARDAAPGEPVREVIDNVGQPLVSFPYHVARGCRSLDPVASLYLLRAWGDPVGRMQGTISLAWLKEEVGVPASAAKQNRLFKRLKAKWLKDGTFVLAEETYVLPRKRGGSRSEDILKVERAIRGFDVAGGALPASPHRQGVLDKDYIADLAGVEVGVLEYPEVKRTLRDVRRRRGLAVPGFDADCGLLAQLLVEGMRRERAAALLSDVKKPQERCSAFRATFVHVVARNGLEMDDPASDLFGDDAWEANRVRAEEAFGNARTASNFRGRANRWKNIYDDLMETATPDGTLAERLKAVLGRRGLSFKQAGDLAGCSWGTIRNWCCGGNVSVALVPALARLEEALGLTGGPLVALARRGWRGTSEREVNPHWGNVPHRAARLLPHEVRFLSDAEIDAAVAKVEPQIRNGSDYAVASNAARSDAYRIPPVEFGERYVAERGLYRLYKTEAIVMPLLRPKEGRWREETTIVERLRELDGLLRFGAAPCTDDKTSGLGMPADKATIAWLAVPGCILRWFHHASTHLDDVDLKDGKRGALFTTRMRHAVWTILSLTHPKFGFLTQQPKFAEALEPIPATASSARFGSYLVFAGGSAGDWILSPAEVEHARSDWRGFVAVAHATAKQMLEYIDDDVSVIRDAMQNAEGLLHGDEPAADFIAALVRAEARFRSERRGVFLATEVRNCIMCHFSLFTGFRPKNVRELVFTGDDRGEIWKEAGVWHLRVDYRKFKNWKSCHLFGTTGHKQGYSGSIDDPLLVALLDDWFHVQRPLLAKPDCEHAFVTLSGGMLNASSWYDACRQFGAKYIVWNPVTQEGLRGVVSINPYVFRAIRATDILVNSDASDKVLEAAFALQTSVEMIRAHYGLLIPEKALSGSRDTYARAMSEARRRAA